MYTRHNRHLKSQSQRAKNRILPTQVQIYIAFCTENHKCVKVSENVDLLA